MGAEKGAEVLPGIRSDAEGADHPDGGLTHQAMAAPAMAGSSSDRRSDRLSVEVRAIAAATGHCLAVHVSSYRWPSEATTTAAFDLAFAT